MGRNVWHVCVPARDVLAFGTCEAKSFPGQTANLEREGEKLHPSRHSINHHLATVDSTISTEVSISLRSANHLQEPFLNTPSPAATMVKLEELEDEHFINRPATSKDDILLADDDDDYTDTGT